MTDRKKKPSVSLLQENVSLFFERFFAKNSDHMKCGQGCSRCCISGLTVFPSEAQVIIDWFDSLQHEAKMRIKSQWRLSLKPEQNSRTEQCKFLINDLCSIYEVRPTVCRSQGLPLKVQSAQDENRNLSEEFELSLCELNFVTENNIPDPSEWLDLDRVNLLLSIAEKNFDKDDLSNELSPYIDQSTGRIGLGVLKSLLLLR